CPPALDEFDPLIPILGTSSEARSDQLNFEMAKLAKLCSSMEDLPLALLGEIISRLTKTSDLNSLSLVSKRLYTVEAELRDSIHVGCGGVYPVKVNLASLCSQFPNLCKVEFNFSGWTPNHGMLLDNEGLRVFSSCCPLLTDLTLSFCSNIDDLGLSFLAHFKKLMSVRLKTLPAITSVGLLSVAVGCKSLSALHLICCNKVGNMDWLEYLGRIGSLEELVVKNCKRISQFDVLRLGPGWMKLHKFEFKIEGLFYSYDPCDPSYVAHNQYGYDFSCENLKDLTLARIITKHEIGLRCLLRKCKALENLCLHFVHSLHDSDMITLANKCSNLKSISLGLKPEHCEVFRTALTDESLKALALRCSMLESFELTFFGCGTDYPEIGFTQEGLVTLIQSCPIRDLVLGGVDILDDKGMKALSRALFLESLELTRCIFITDAGLCQLACSPRLINLKLVVCDGITDYGVGEVVRRRKLEFLTIEQCAKVSQEAVKGAAKSVQYRDDCPSFVKWVDYCVYGNKV
ncbi:hypothetical protein EJB05_21961, partial [Eragrostis curvula]